MLPWPERWVGLKCMGRALLAPVSVEAHGYVRSTGALRAPTRDEPTRCSLAPAMILDAVQQLDLRGATLQSTRQHGRKDLAPG